MTTIKKHFILSLLLLAGGLLTNLSAQENLKKWIAKCEKDPTIDITVIEKKNPETGKRQSETTVLSFPDKMSPELMKELQEAFDKDKDKAYRVSQKRVGGVNRPDYCRFADLKNKIETRFLFEFSKKEFFSPNKVRTVITMQIFYDYVEPAG